MKKIIVTGFFLMTGWIAYSQSNIDVLHYRFHIAVSDDNDSIYGVTFIKFVVTEKKPFVQFDLAAVNTKGKGMLVTSTGFRMATNTTTFSQQGDRVIIPSSFNKGDTAEAIINYKGIPADGLIISNNKYGDRTFFADNWPNRAHNWIPCKDEPGDKASFEFLVNAPSHYRVIANGVMTEEDDMGHHQKLTHWVEDVPSSTKVMVIGVAKFAVKTYDDSPANIPVSAWVYEQDSLPGFKNYSVAPAIVKFLTSYIGPYPYEKLANVQSKTIFGGMENASAIFYEETSASLLQNIESLLAHEIAHQWFGDMASEKSFSHLWLSEGFATYLTHLYIESKYGTDSLNHEMRKDRGEVIAFAKESGTAIVDSVSPLMQLLNPNSYQKGGWLLHMLRRQLGDTVFHKIIRNYYAAYAGKNADTRDFQRVCEKESRKNLGIFFDQWAYSPGLPKMDIQWKYIGANKKILVTITQLQKNLFQFPLDIQLVGVSGKSQLTTLTISKQTQKFSIAVKEKVVKINVDPKTSLLFDGSLSVPK